MRRVRGQSSLNCNIKRRLSLRTDGVERDKSNSENTVCNGAAYRTQKFHSPFLVRVHFSASFLVPFVIGNLYSTKQIGSGFSLRKTACVLPLTERDCLRVFVSASSNCCSFTTLQTPVSQNPSNTNDCPPQKWYSHGHTGCTGVPVLLRLEQTPFDKRCETLCWDKL